MGTIVRQDIPEKGAEITLVAAAGGGDVVDNRDGRTVLIIKNAHSSPQTVTVVVQDTNASTPKFGTTVKTDAVLAVTNAKEATLGPFPVAAYNNSSHELVITYSGVTNLSVGGVRYNKIGT